MTQPCETWLDRNQAVPLLVRRKENAPMTTLPRSLLALAIATTACDDINPGETDEPGEVSQGVATTSFTATYTGQGNGATTCNTSFNISGQEPSTTGTFPVFLYTIGT